MKRESSLLSRITLTMWVMTTVSTVVSALLIGNLLIRSHRESIHAQLQASATSLITLGISDFSELDDFGHLDHFIEDALQMEKVDKIVRIFNRNGKLAFTTVRLGYDHLPNKLSEKITKPQFVPLEGETRKYESLIVPYYGEENRLKFYLQIAIPLPRYSEVLDSLWWQALLILGLLVGVSLFLASHLSARLLKPVTDISEHLKKIDPERIDEWKPLAMDEKGHYLKAIIDGINLLVAKTTASVRQLRKMSRYVAHEMRTPLTILQGEAETVLENKNASREDYAKVLKSSLEEVERMSEIVTTVLTLGESKNKESPSILNGIPLTSWFQEQIPLWEKTLGRPVQFSMDPSGLEILVKTEPHLLFQLVDNLVRNVRDHAPAGTPCLISLESSDSEATLKVIDNGPGLPPSLLEALNRNDTTHEKVGVGLHLCQKIAETCQLKLHYNPPDQGTGLVVIVSLQLSFDNRIQLAKRSPLKEATHEDSSNSIAHRSDRDHPHLGLGPSE